MLYAMSSIESETRTRILEATWQLMEERRGLGVRMRDVADAASVSRQAVYLHFGSRAELMIATTQYIDQVLGLNDRLRRFQAAIKGVDILEEYVGFWGNYVPEIYGLAKALMLSRETDEAAAAVWKERMTALREGCCKTIDALLRDGELASVWTREVAIDLLWTMLSIRNWEHLTIECGWTPSQYVDRMQKLLKRILVKTPS